MHFSQNPVDHCIYGKYSVAEAICPGESSGGEKDQPVKQTTYFIRAGDKSKATLRATSELLKTAEEDWQLSVDLGSQLRFILLRPPSGLTLF